MLKSKDSNLSKSWTVVKRQGASFTGGPISLSKDGRVAVCMCNDRASLLDIDTGSVIKVIPPQGADDEPLCAFGLSPDGAVLVTCSRNQMMRLWNVADGRCSKSWKGHRAPVSCTTIDPSGTLVATGSSDRCVMVWDLDHGHATHSFRGHAAVVTVVAFLPHPQSVQRLASACESGEVRVWDLPTSTAVAVLSEHSSAVTAIAFSPDPSGYTMLTAGRDSMINLWDTRDWDSARPEGAQAGPTTVGVRVQVSAHEVVEGLAVLPSASTEASAGKDFCFVTAGDRGLLRLWRTTISGKDNATRRYGCGVVGGRSMQQIRQQQSAEEALLDAAGCAAAISAQPGGGVDVPLSDQFASVIIRQGSSSGTASCQLLAVSRDHVLTILDAPRLGHVKTIVGYSDEIVDIKYVPAPLALPADLSDAARASFVPHVTHQRCTLAIATNSEQLRLVDAATLDSRLCHGHAGVILCVAVSPDGALVSTASKDRTARVWDVASGACIAECIGHTESVTAAAWPVRPSHFMHAAPTLAAGSTVPAVLGTQAWLATASKDRTVKLWALGALLARLPSPRPGTTDSSRGWSREDALGTGPLFRPLTSAAVVAHEKDINSIAVSPNDAFLATGSQDKTVRLWGVPGLVPLATLRGHRRGIWAVAFSGTDRVLASASGDRTVRLWNMSPGSGYACLRTLEGHEASVLAVSFLRRGTQLVTAGADGLVKLWNVADGECANTFDAHTEKVWALAVRPTGLGGVTEVEDVAEIVTGGSDSVLNVWHDATATEAASEMLATEAALLKQQRLYGAMALRDYAGAVMLALELQQPARIGDILCELLEAGPSPRTAGLAPHEEEARFAALMRAEVSDMRAELAGSDDSVSAGEGGAKTPAELRQQGLDMFTALLRNLPPADLGRLIGYVREWNTQSRHGLLAQRVLSVLLRVLPQATLAAALLAAKNDASSTRMLPGIGAVRTSKGEPTASEVDRMAGCVDTDPAEGRIDSSAAATELAVFVEGLLPYSERHFDRLDRLSVAAYGVDAALAAMHVLQDDTVSPAAGLEINGPCTSVVTRPLRELDSSSVELESEEGSDKDSVDGKRVGGGWLSRARAKVPASSAPTAKASGKAGAPSKFETPAYDRDSDGRVLGAESGARSKSAGAKRPRARAS